jgi:hypothetical protein
MPSSAPPTSRTVVNPRPQHPLGLGQRTHRGVARRPRGRIGQIEACYQQMYVRVDQPGHQRRRGRVDHPRI